VPPDVPLELSPDEESHNWHSWVCSSPSVAPAGSVISRVLMRIAQSRHSTPVTTVTFVTGPDEEPDDEPEPELLGGPEELPDDPEPDDEGPLDEPLPDDDPLPEEPLPLDDELPLEDDPELDEPVGQQSTSFSNWNQYSTVGCEP